MKLTKEQKESIDGVLDFYGEKSAQWLSDLTHLEAPWHQARARAGVSAGERCYEEITLADMHEYYSGLGEESETAQMGRKKAQNACTRSNAPVSSSCAPDTQSGINSRSFAMLA